MLLSFSLAGRPIENKPTPHKGVMELKTEANLRLGLDVKPKPTMSADSIVAQTLDANSKKMKGYPSLVKMREMIIVEEDEENGSGTTKPLGHSPGIGHNNPPGNRP
ncbi:hypothetical protein SUGI_0697790 [Cryptomeria japonica]|nr:hypothetical protein SUGI_0697790 [Cryptomeria japonica]